MKLKILKIEVASQFLLTISAVLFYFYVILFTDEHEIEIIYLALLFLIGILNIIGFVLRLFLVRSKFNSIYLFGVLTYFILSFTLYFFSPYDFERNIDVIMIYLFITGFLFNIYYLFYGYLLIKTWQPKPLEN